MNNENEHNFSSQSINQNLGYIQRWLKTQEENSEKQTMQIDKLYKDVIDIEKRLIRIEEFYNSSKEKERIKIDNTLTTIGTIISTLITSCLIGLTVCFFNGNFNNDNYDNGKNEIELLYKR